MPSLFFESINRHQFLKYSAAAAGCLVLSPVARVLGAETENIRLALLSDTHIPTDLEETYRDFAPVKNLQQVVPQVLESQPLAVVINGDAARMEGLTGDYQRLRDLMSPIAAETPVLIGLGNHDDRGNFLATFPEDSIVGERQPVSGKHVIVMEFVPLRVILLDTLMYVNKVAGLLGKGAMRLAVEIPGCLR